MRGGRLKDRLAVLVIVPLLVAVGLPRAGAGPADGFNSPNVEYVGFVPFEVGTATGAKVVGRHLYVTGWRSFSIYDVSKPLEPVLLSTTPFGFKFENEDVATNGKIMIFSETLPLSILHVWDVEDKTRPVEIAALSGAGSHTTECLYDCAYSYGSDGTVTDLRDPSHPKEVGRWSTGKPASNAHDVNEIAPGLVLTSSRPIMLLDARQNLLEPTLAAVGDDRAITGIVHSNRWPRGGRDRWVLFSSESNATGRCGSSNGAFMVWDSQGYEGTHTLRLVDTYRLSSGSYSDGRPAANVLGCSTHWFQERPDFFDGGIVALGAYEHGTRFVAVSAQGEITEVGYFLPHGGSTSAAYWLTNEIVYAVDYTRGIDILRFRG